jgi:hypothetical protein
LRQIHVHESVLTLVCFELRFLFICLVSNKPQCLAFSRLYIVRAVYRLHIWKKRHHNFSRNCTQQLALINNIQISWWPLENIRLGGHIDHFEKQLYLPITYIERNPIYIHN